eukprot:jgi/Pico_ML_1/54535/g4869.t1
MARSRSSTVPEGARGRKKRVTRAATAVKDALRKWLAGHRGVGADEATHDTKRWIAEEGRDAIQDDEETDPDGIPRPEEGRRRRTCRSNVEVESFEALLLPPLADPRDAESPRVWKDEPTAWHVEGREASSAAALWEQLREFLLTREEDVEAFRLRIQDVTTSLREALLHLEERSLPSDLRLDLSAWFSDPCRSTSIGSASGKDAVQEVLLGVEERFESFLLPFEEMWRGCESYLSFHSTKPDPSTPVFWDAPLGQLVLSWFGMDPPSVPSDEVDGSHPQQHPSRGPHHDLEEGAPRTSSPDLHESVQALVDQWIPPAPGAEGSWEVSQAWTGRTADVWREPTRRLWRGIPALAAQEKD